MDTTDPQFGDRWKPNRNSQRLAAELASVQEVRTLPIEARIARAYGLLDQAIAEHQAPSFPGNIRDDYQLGWSRARASVYVMTDAEYAQLLTEPVDIPDEIEDAFDPTELEEDPAVVDAPDRDDPAEAA